MAQTSQTFRLFNSLTKRVEDFVAADPGVVTMYTCGPTVYDYAHIGNFRSFLFADTLRRWLESPLCAIRDERGEAHQGPRRVVQVMNITDVGHMTDDEAADGGGEDKMEAASKRLLEAKKSGKLPPDAPKDFDPSNPFHIARFYEHAFLEDARLLGVKVASEREGEARAMPRATEHVKQMLAMIRGLIEKGFAYVDSGGAGDAVYFDTQRFPEYGALSGNTLENLRAGAGGRVSEANQSGKRHAADFLLWKRDAKHVMKWDPGAPEMLGADAGPLKGMVGYPGWHIECSAMAESSVRAIAGTGFRHTLDLHTGGEDNIFPHHECEIAQSRCAWGVERFARQWAHVRHLMVEGEKMSKSKGNFYTIRDLLSKGFDPAAIRLELIKTHYRSNANFSLQGLQDSTKRIERWRNLARTLDARVRDAERHDDSDPPNSILLQCLHEFKEGTYNDLNMSLAIASIDRMAQFVGSGPTNGELPTEPMPVGKASSIVDDPSCLTFKRELALVHLFDHVLGVIFRPAYEAPTEHDPRADELRLARDAARKAKNWSESDRLRDELVALGYEVKDTPGGTVVTKKATL
jgi:cysteinyl-tRNA synthetase